MPQLLARSNMRVVVLIVIEVIVLVGLLVFAATIAIPIAAPPPNQPTPTLPVGALHDCPVGVPGCG
jgi:hypothetical protein